jgi:hypothetical protein
LKRSQDQTAFESDDEPADKEAVYNAPSCLSAEHSSVDHPGRCAHEQKPGEK